MEPAGSRASALTGRTFLLAHCHACRFSCVIEPRTDYADVYDKAYYRGEGGDAAVRYEQDHLEPRTIRTYEWQGMLELVQSLRPVTPDTTWLDFGAGLGGFVTFLRAHGYERAVGFDEGYARRRMHELGVPQVPEDPSSGHARFDVVTAIEVIEHAVDPVATLREMAAYLRPGGLLVLTTGNARPYRGKLEQWSYVQPDVHVSFFEPETLARALGDVGLEPAFTGYSRGWRGIIRYKILKAVHRRRRGLTEQVLPWGLITRFVDRRRGVSAQPIAWRRTSQ